jgi:hypothetical protein
VPRLLNATDGLNKQPKILPELRSRHPKTILQSSYAARNPGCAVPANASRDLVPAYMNNPGQRPTCMAIRLWCSFRILLGRGDRTYPARDGYAARAWQAPAPG